MRLCVQALNFSIKIVKKHEDARDGNNQNDNATLFSSKQPDRIAIKNVLICVICKLYCKITDANTKLRAFAKIKELENGHTIKIITEESKKIYNQELLEVPHNLMLYRFATASFMEEMNIECHADTLYIGESQNIKTAAAAAL